MITELLVLLVALAIGWSYLEKRIPKFPPGPLGLPLLGHLPRLGTYPHKTLLQWKKTYGPIIGVWFGSYRTVTINDAKLIREAMNTSAFLGRPRLNLFTARSEDGIVRGIGFTDGTHWKEQRKFALKNLRDFGIGAKSMEGKIQQEVCELVESLKTKEGKPIQVKGLFNIPVINAFWSILLGHKLKENDPESLAALRSLTGFLDDTSLVGSLSMFMPWLAQIAPKLSGFEKMIEGYPGLKDFLRKQIKIHNVDYVENQPRDFVDAYTDEIKRTTDPDSSFHPNNDTLTYTLFDLFAAGTETTSTTLSWLCAYLVHHQHVQKKLQEEIDQVVGRERVPSLSDRSSMPYTEAVLNEVMRVSSILPFSVFHCATEDVEFHGFFIPKDTIIIPNLYAVHYDETIWGDPENFRPERFIDSAGKFKKNENLIPFCSGKRVCLGEGVARDELFLFTTTLFQTFCVSVPGELPDLEPHLGITLSPQPFEIFMKIRVE